MFHAGRNISVFSCSRELSDCQWRVLYDSNDRLFRDIEEQLKSFETEAHSAAPRCNQPWLCRPQMATCWNSYELYIKASASWI